MIKLFNTLFDFVSKYTIVKKTFKIRKSWKIPILSKIVMNENKKNVISIYYKIIKIINFNLNHQKLLFYIDGSKKIK